ncbi:MAG: hypothetical protein IKE69_12585, partial [Thermoguttaceae bacterium]|nr:hypothetical protein [Thermoguttaceae bacterium]
MKNSPYSSKLRVECLEERALLAVTAGGLEQAIGLIAPTESAIWVVNTLEDPSEWDPSDNILSLREAVSRAADGDSVAFASELSDGRIILNGPQLFIDKGIAIDASSIGGMTIDAVGKSRVFEVTGGTDDEPVELIGLTITGGWTYGDGGGIYNSGTLTLTNSTVSGNTASSSYYSYYYSYGGGIYNGGTLTLTNSTVSGNTAFSSYSSYSSSYYSTSYSYGGGIYNSGTLTLTNSTVSGNTASSSYCSYSYGGGIYNSGTLTLTNSTVSGNTASSSSRSYGGGIYNGGTLTLTNSTVSGNTASSSDSHGGGIYNDGYSYIYNTVIAQNNAKTGTDVYNTGFLYAYNTLSSFTGWTESVECLAYDETKPLFHVGNGFCFLADNSQAINKGNNGYISG